jgi:hypothetical protein
VKLLRKILGDEDMCIEKIPKMKAYASRRPQRRRPTRHEDTRGEDLGDKNLHAEKKLETMTHKSRRS